MRICRRLAAMALAGAVVLSAPAGCARRDGGAAEGGSGAAADGETEAASEVVIGVSLGTLQEKSGTQEADRFQQYAEENDVSISVLSANGDTALQTAQCENLIDQGIDVLLLQPLEGMSAAAVVEKAHEAGIKVISYDRLAADCDVDYCVDFNAVQSGETQEQIGRRNRAACELAVACARGTADEKDAVEASLGTWSEQNNGFKDVESFRVEVLPVTKDNVDEAAVGRQDDAAQDGDADDRPTA